MPGTARTSQFNFSTATVMIAPMATAGAINSAAHSVGLTKNFQFTLDNSSVDLTQGIENQVVFSMINKQSVKASCEIMELTARNLAYGLGLDATSPTNFVPSTDYAPLEAPVAAAATTFLLTTDHTATFVAGAWCFLQEGLDDSIHLAQIVSSVFSTPNTTVTINTPVPTGMSFDTAGGRAGVLNKVDANPTLANQMFAVRVLGVTASDKRPIGLHMPKVKIAKGFSMAFSDTKFDSLPFEFEPFAPLTTDDGYSSNFSQIFSVFVP